MPVSRQLVLWVGSIALLAAVMSAATCDAVEGQAPPPLSGRWQYLQPPDNEGEVLDLSFSLGHWRGILNGLERAGEHGLFYYVVEVESLEVDADGTVRFVVGERLLSSRRPALSVLGAKGEAGVNRYRMRFAGGLEAGDLVLRCVERWGSCPDSTLRFKRIGMAAKSAAAPDTTGFEVAFRFSVTDTTEVFERPLGSALRIRVARDWGMGWDVSVVRKSPRADLPNLLYHSRTWHGPYPTQVFAWSHQDRTFPDERHLPVYGYPYEIRVRLLDCRTSGTGDHVVFDAGTIEVAWRRAKVRSGDSY